MAIIKMGALVTQISGKIGGQTLGRSRSGDYIRNTGVPTIRPTLKQVQQRSRLAKAASRWRLLTPEQRNAFNLASPEYPYTNRVGETKFYTGFQIFMLLINTRPGSGVIGIPTPLPRVSFGLARATRVQVTPGHWVVSALDTDQAFNYSIFISRPLSPGVTNNYVNRYYVISGTGAQLSSGGIDIWDAYNENIGTPPVGAKFFVTLDVVDNSTGQGRKRVGQASFISQG